MSDKLKKFVLPILLVFYFSLFFAQKTNLTTADLGRHITNGKVFFQERHVISINYYAYTEPEEI